MTVTFTAWGPLGPDWVSKFLPANRAQLLLRRWIIRSTHLPGIDRLVSRRIVGRIAK